MCGEWGGFLILWNIYELFWKWLWEKDVWLKIRYSYKNRFDWMWNVYKDKNKKVKNYWFFSSFFIIIFYFLGLVWNFFIDIDRRLKINKGFEGEMGVLMVVGRYFLGKRGEFWGF